MFRYLALSAVLCLGVAHPGHDGFNITRWADNQKKSLMKMKKTTTAGRLLADDDACNPFAIFAIVLPAIMIPAMVMPVHLGNKDFVCQMMKDGKACSPKSAAQCNSGCEWSLDDKGVGECGPFGMGMFQTMVDPDAGSVFAMMIAAAKKCNDKTQSTCSNGCEWKADENKCDMGPSYLEGENAMCKTTNWKKILSGGMTCNAITDQTQCTGDCETKQEGDTTKCDLAGAKFMELMYGSNAGARLSMQLVKQGMCAADETCSGAGCTNNGDACVAGMGAWGVSLAKKRSECQKKTKAACSGDCSPNDDGRRLGAHVDGGDEKPPPECDLRKEYMEKLCAGQDTDDDGATAAGGEADGATSVVTFVPLLIVLAGLFVQ